MNNKTVLVSGCFDLLHAGHIAFFESAAAYGKLHVSIGSDENIRLLKGKSPYFSQQERLYIVNAIESVERAFVSSGSGMLDFEPDLRNLKPDFFVVNEDGHTEEKERLCKELGVEYVVLERIPADELPDRSSSQIKKELGFPYRVSIAGGWIDQPWVSSVCSGSMVVASIWPTIDFNDRSGMATSSRKVAIELWADTLPQGDPVRMAQLLFGAENPPGREYVSGSQDHIGLLVPGISRLYYEGRYWPSRIDTTVHKDTCDWLSDVVNLVPLEPRPEGYDPLEVKNLEYEWISKLGLSGEKCWQSILDHDVNGLGESLTLSLNCWQKILPATVADYAMAELDKYASHPGATFSGCGGGYILVASDKRIDGALKVRVRY